MSKPYNPLPPGEKDATPSPQFRSWIAKYIKQYAQTN